LLQIFSGSDIPKQDQVSVNGFLICQVIAGCVFNIVCFMLASSDLYLLVGLRLNWTITKHHAFPSFAPVNVESPGERITEFNMIKVTANPTTVALIGKPKYVRAACVGISGASMWFPNMVVCLLTVLQIGNLVTRCAAAGTKRIRNLEINHGSFCLPPLDNEENHDNHVPASSHTLFPLFTLVQRVIS
jgi:hypothetical protein